MADVKKNLKLSIIIPTINEAHRIPYLLSTLCNYPYPNEIIIVDGGSDDSTAFNSKLYGAKVYNSLESNRGLQLKMGAEIANGEWLLFLHADSKLEPKWINKIWSKLNDPRSRKVVWFFNFKVNKKGLVFRLMEFSVNLRSNLLKLPFGDQGLLIEKNLYIELGGYKPIHIMEDLDFINRIKRKVQIRTLGVQLETDGRRWEGRNVLKTCINNARLRLRWQKGVAPKELFAEYYSNRIEK